MILCIENPKWSTKSLLELLGKFRKGVIYQSNMQKSISNKQYKNEIKKTILSIIAS